MSKEKGLEAYCLERRIPESLSQLYSNNISFPLDSQLPCSKMCHNQQQQKHLGPFLFKGTDTPLSNISKQPFNQCFSNFYMQIKITQGSLKCRFLSISRCVKCLLLKYCYGSDRVMLLVYRSYYEQEVETALS